MKNFASLLLMLLCCTIGQACTPPKENKQDNQQESAVVVLTDERFRQEVFDYAHETEWKFRGDKPVLIDFYATWCGPCRRVAPIVAELAAAYKDQIVVYKVDTDQESNLAGAMGIRSLPTLVFIPLNEKPQVIVGAADKATLQRAIEEVLLGKKQP
ncbi:MAG: thioredoxin [Bacteroidaceae bacterium]